MPQNVIFNIDCGAVRPVYKGDYNSSAVYSYMDLAKYDGTVYQCIVNSVTGVPPTDLDDELNAEWIPYVVPVPGPVGPVGNSGVTYHPSVSAEGVLSWTVNGGAPQPVNIVDMVVAAMPDVDTRGY